MTGQTGQGEAAPTTAPDGAMLPAGLLDLLRQPSPCFVATVMPDGSPQVTQTWVDTDGEHVLINIIVGSQKSLNIDRNPRVALNICDPSRTGRYYQVRGHVGGTIAEGAAEHMNMLSHRYTGRPYSSYTGQPEARLIVVIDADSVTPPFLDQLQSRRVEGSPWVTR